MISRTVAITPFVLVSACCGCGSPEAVEPRYDPIELDRLVRHLADQGWVLYGKRGCELCRAQREVFGPAIARIMYVECDPFAENSEAERCVSRGIKQLPAWVRERDGKEIQRLDKYYSPESLAEATGCEFRVRKRQSD